MEERYGEIDLNKYYVNGGSKTKGISYNEVFNKFLKFPADRYIIDVYNMKFVDNYGDIYQQFCFSCINSNTIPISFVYNNRIIPISENFNMIFDSNNKFTKTQIDKIKNKGYLPNFNNIIKEAKESIKLESDIKKEIQIQKETSSQEISQLKEDMKSLIKSMNALKEYCLELQKIGDDQQKILEELCKENIEIKKELRELRDSKNTSISNESTESRDFKPSLPSLPSISEIIKNTKN